LKTSRINTERNGTLSMTRVRLRGTCWIAFLRLYRPCMVSLHAIMCKTSSSPRFHKVSHSKLKVKSPSINSRTLWVPS
jgi:hypothetical protein